MTPESNNRRDWIVTIGFFLFVSVPISVHISAPDTQISHAEKRLQADAPTMPDSLAGWFSLPYRTDAYLTDHFGLRQPMVRAFALLKYSIGDSVSDRAQIGRDGWLFVTENNVIDQHRGIDVFSEAGLDEWVANLQTIANAVRRCGSQFLFVVAPNKHTIYPEHLPRWATRVGNSTRVDQLFQRLAESTDIRHVDLRPLLMAAKDDQQVYFRRDTHWNLSAGFLAYSAIMRAAEGSLFDTTTLAFTDLSRKTDVRRGDLARMLGLEDFLIESTMRLEAVDQASGWDSEHVARYTADAADNRVYVLEYERQDHPKIMMIGDSFSEALTPFFDASASTYILTHHRFGNFDFRPINEYQPDLVVLEIAERVLNLPLGLPDEFEEMRTHGATTCRRQSVGWYSQ